MLGTKSKPTVSTEKKSTASLNGTRDSGETCVLSLGTVIEGKFSATENVRLDGLIKGEVRCEKRLVMGEKGRVEGKVEVHDAVIMGVIEGEVSVKGKLTLKSTALIRGPIVAKSMEVEEGARYIGDCNIGG